MTATCYVTFGQKHRHEGHPRDVRAHPDGWFEYVAATFEDAAAAARQHLLTHDARGRPVAAFADSYDADDFEPAYYPRGCLARFEVDAYGIKEVAL